MTPRGTTAERQRGSSLYDQAPRAPLARDVEDPEFLREYVVESMRIATMDQVVNAIDDAREAAGHDEG